MTPPDFQPMRVLSFELATNEICALSGPPDAAGYSRAQVLIRIHDEPVGVVTVEVGADSLEDELRIAAWQQCSEQIIEHLAFDHLVIPTAPEDLATLNPNCPSRAAKSTDEVLVSVAIPTLRNVDSAINTVRRILQSTYGNLEVIVVDNDGHDSSLASALSESVTDSRVRYTHEPQTGVSRARNKGLFEATGNIVVFTDDDVVVDPRWIERIVAAFESDIDVACVTGAILPAELETISQVWLEEFGGFNKGFARQMFNLIDHSRPEPLYPYNAGQFGSGANMAFRVDVLKSIGGFAVNLGPGTPTYGGEDIDALRRVITSGHTLVYEPSALLWHFHRRSYEALRRQMFRYGVGLSSAVTKWVAEDRRTAIAVFRRIPPGLVHVLKPSSEKNRQKSGQYPAALTLLELAGLAAGPIAFFRSRRKYG